MLAGSFFPRAICSHQYCFWPRLDWYWIWGRIVGVVALFSFSFLWCFLPHSFSIWSNPLILCYCVHIYNNESNYETPPYAKKIDFPCEHLSCSLLSFCFSFSLPDSMSVVSAVPSITYGNEQYLRFLFLSSSSSSSDRIVTEH